MKIITKTLFTLILLFSLTNCSSDDSNSENNDNNTSENLPDNLYSTTWRFIDGGEIHTMFFQKSDRPNRTQITSSLDIVDGAYTYNKPNLILEYDDNCFPQFEESTFAFDTCSLTGVVNSNSITVINNGKEFKFILIENETP